MKPEEVYNALENGQSVPLEAQEIVHLASEYICSMTHVDRLREYLEVTEWTDSSQNTVEDIYIRRVILGNVLLELRLRYVWTPVYGTFSEVTRRKLALAFCYAEQLDAMFRVFPADVQNSLYRRFGKAYI